MLDKLAITNLQILTDETITVFEKEIAVLEKELELLSLKGKLTYQSKEEKLASMKKHVAKLKAMERMA